MIAPQIFNYMADTLHDNQYILCICCTNLSITMVDSVNADLFDYAVIVMYHNLSTLMNNTSRIWLE